MVYVYASATQARTNLKASLIMGVIWDVYLKYKVEGDQYIKKFVSGVAVCFAKFAILLSQLDYSDVERSDILKNSFYPGYPISLLLLL